MKLSENEERRKLMLSLLIDHIHIDAKQHLHGQNKSDEFLNGYQECLEVLRVLLIEGFSI
jgi:hypothetical protein